MYFIELIQENAQMEVMDSTDKSDEESDSIYVSIRKFTERKISFLLSSPTIPRRLAPKLSFSSFEDAILSSSEEVEHSD